jgi:hypothetical protein
MGGGKPPDNGKPKLTPQSSYNAETPISPRLIGVQALHRHRSGVCLAAPPTPHHRTTHDHSSPSNTFFHLYPLLYSHPKPPKRHRKYCPATPIDDKHQSAHAHTSLSLVTTHYTPTKSVNNRIFGYLPLCSMSFVKRFASTASTTMS